MSVIVYEYCVYRRLKSDGDVHPFVGYLAPTADDRVVRAATGEMTDTYEYRITRRAVAYDDWIEVNRADV
jgi:hypothetical protein